MEIEENKMLEIAQQMPSMEERKNMMLLKEDIKELNLMS